MGLDTAALNLEIDHNVYLIGAGFSYDAGLPLVADFFSKMRDALNWLNEQGRHDDCAAIESVLRFRRQAAAAGYHVRLDLDNIEHLFSLVAATPGAKDERFAMPTAIAATLDYAAKRGRDRPNSHVRFKLDGVEPGDLRDCWQISSDRSEAVIPRYDVIVGTLVGYFSRPRTNFADNTFISFNYDTLVEHALANLGIEHHFGLPGQTKKGIGVHKLHGSVSWYNDPPECTPLIVPPTWTKSLPSKLQTVWDGAVEALARATRIVVLGFSFAEADRHVQYLLAAGLAHNISLRKIVVVDPATRGCP